MDSYRLVTVPNPAAGANFVYQQPANLFSKVIQCRFLFVASAAVAIRTPQVVTFDGGLLLSTVKWATTTLAGVSRSYICVDGAYAVEVNNVIAGASYPLRESGGFWLLPGRTFESLIDLIQAADQISLIRILFQDVNLVSPGVVG